MNGIKLKPRVLVMIAGACIAVLLVVIGFLVWKLQQNGNGDLARQEETRRIIDKVDNLYLLPTSEEPTVAQVQDKSKLGNQAFFEDAENGDYILIYKEKKIALVYRESANKLINVGPINLDEDANGETAGAQTQQSGQ